MLPPVVLCDIPDKSGSTGQKVQIAPLPRLRGFNSVCTCKLRSCRLSAARCSSHCEPTNHMRVSHGHTSVMVMLAMRNACVMCNSAFASCAAAQQHLRRACVTRMFEADRGVWNHLPQFHKRRDCPSRYRFFSDELSFHVHLKRQIPPRPRSLRIELLLQHGRGSPVGRKRRRPACSRRRRWRS